MIPYTATFVLLKPDGTFSSVYAKLVLHAKNAVHAFERALGVADLIRDFPENVELIAAVSGDVQRYSPRTNLLFREPGV